MRVCIADIRMMISMISHAHTNREHNLFWIACQSHSFTSTVYISQFSNCQREQRTRILWGACERCSVRTLCIAQSTMREPIFLGCKYQLNQKSSLHQHSQAVCRVCTRGRWLFDAAACKMGMNKKRVVAKGNGNAHTYHYARNTHTHTDAHTNTHSHHITLRETHMTLDAAVGCCVYISLDWNGKRWLLLEWYSNSRHSSQIYLIVWRRKKKRIK